MANENAAGTGIPSGVKKDVVEPVSDRWEDTIPGPILQVHWPLPALLNVLDEARDWAAFAPDAQVEALALACYEQLPKERRIDLVRYLRDQVPS